MSTPVSMQYIQDVTQSLIYFLNNNDVIRSGASSYTSDTLKEIHPTLNIELGYPDRLNGLALPTLALVNNSSDPMTQGFGNHVKAFNMSYSIHGFVGREQSHGGNMLLRDQLCEEVRSLFEDIDYITLYQYPDFSTNEGDVGITNVVASYIPPSDTMEAARYQFIIDLNIEYIKEI